MARHQVPGLQIVLPYEYLSGNTVWHFPLVVPVSLSVTNFFGEFAAKTGNTPVQFRVFGGYIKSGKSRLCSRGHVVYNFTVLPFTKKKYS